MCIGTQSPGKQGVAGSIPGGGTYFHSVFFRLLPVAYSSTKNMQMKLSMAFMQSNGFTKIDFIFKNIAAVYRLLWLTLSAVLSCVQMFIKLRKKKWESNYVKQ